MKQRGRKSAANLAVLPVANVRHQLQPPDHLTAREAQLFCEVLANAPANQFSFSDQYMLATFAQVTVLLRDQAKRVHTAKREHRAAELKLLNDMVKSQGMVVTKLRLTTSARTAMTTTGHAHDKHRPSAYDVMREQGWD